MPHKILLKQGDGGAIRKELVAGGTITPGMLVERTSSDTAQAHSTPGGNAATAFASENDLVGDGIDDDYDSGDTVQLRYCQRGEEVYALLADGEDVSIGAQLESDGTGALQEHTPVGSDVQANAIVAIALEAINNASGDVVRIKVEVV